MNLPAHLINRKSRGLAQAAIEGLGGNQSPYISIESNRFTLIDGAGNKKRIDSLSLNVVIVDVNKNVSKIYYADAYDPSATEFVAPTCFSDNGAGPSAQAKKPQHSNCMTCPHNQWGSATSKVTGKQTKECNDVKKIAVLVPDHDKKMVFLLRVPPASLKNFKAYCNVVGAGTIGDRPVDLSDVVTKLSFESQGVLGFEPVSFIDEETAQRIDALDSSDQTAMIVGRTDRPCSGEAPTARGSSPVLAIAKEPAPVVEATPVEEPKRRGRPAGSTNKTKGEVQAELQRANEAADAEDIPAFLKPRSAAPAQQAETVSAPDDALQAALQSAFNL